MGFTTILLASSLASSRKTAARRRSYQRMRNYNSLYKSMSLQKGNSETKNIDRKEFYGDLIVLLEQIKKIYKEIAVEEIKKLEEKKLNLEKELSIPFQEMDKLQEILRKRLIKLTTDQYGVNISFNGQKIPDYLTTHSSPYEIDNWDFNALDNKKIGYEERINSLSSYIIKLEKILKFRIIKREELKYEIASNKNALENIINEYKSFLKRYEVFINLRDLSNEERLILGKYLKLTREKEIIMFNINSIERKKEKLLSKDYYDLDMIELAVKEVLKKEETLPTSLEKIIFLVKIYLSEELDSYYSKEELPISLDIVKAINRVCRKEHIELSEKVERMLEDEEYEEVLDEKNNTLKLS